MIHLIHTRAYSQGNVFFGMMIQENGLARALSELCIHDRGSYDHSIEEGSICLDMGYDNGFSLEQLYLLTAGSHLHDIGKIKVPLHILRKTAQLEPDEQAEMDKHPRTGFDMLTRLGHAEFAEICIRTHEWQVRAYPRQNSNCHAPNGEERRHPHQLYDELSQIVAVADMFEALINPRCYKPAWPVAQVEPILKQKFTGNPKYIDQVLRRYGP